MKFSPDPIKLIPNSTVVYKNKHYISIDNYYTGHACNFDTKPLSNANSISVKRSAPALVEINLIICVELNQGNSIEYILHYIPLLHFIPLHHWINKVNFNYSFHDFNYVFSLNWLLSRFFSNYFKYNRNLMPHAAP